MIVVIYVVHVCHAKVRSVRMRVMIRGSHNLSDLHIFVWFCVHDCGRDALQQISGFKELVLTCWVLSYSNLTKPNNKPGLI